MGQQCGDGLRGLGHGQMREEVIEVGPGLQAVGLDRFHQAIEGGTDLRPLGAAGEKLVFATGDKGPDAVLRGVIVDLQMLIIQ